jgi:phosphate transport system substrate-binding protein
VTAVSRERAGRRWGGVAAVVVAAGCNAAKPSPGADVAAASVTRISLAGSTALVPLVTEAANRYMRKHPGVVIEVSAGGSIAGLEKLQRGTVTIGTSDVFTTDPNQRGFVDHRIAVVGFATMANRGDYNASLTSLSNAALRGIFTGKVKDWSEVGGGPQPLVMVNRVRASGTRAAFAAIVLGGDKFGPAIEQESSSKVQAMLLEMKGAISYLALSYRHDALITFAYEGVQPTTENITAGTYPVWSYEHLYTSGPATEDVEGFIRYVESDEIQNDVVPRLGFIPIRRMKVSRDHD